IGSLGLHISYSCQEKEKQSNLQHKQEVIIPHSTPSSHESLVGSVTADVMI
ncbi:hypothetical protein KI387_012841, partial [Taxus chinensis]